MLNPDGPIRIECLLLKRLFKQGNLDDAGKYRVNILTRLSGNTSWDDHYITPLKARLQLVWSHVTGHLT